MFASVKLGVPEERIRKMLIAENPGEPHQYGCFMITIKNPDSLKSIMWSPVKERIGGHLCYRFQIWGIFWYFVVSSHSKYHPAAPVFLTTTGILYVTITNWSEQEILANIRKAFIESGKI